MKEEERVFGVRERVRERTAQLPAVPEVVLAAIQVLPVGPEPGSLHGHLPCLR